MRTGSVYLIVVLHAPFGPRAVFQIQSQDQSTLVELDKIHPNYKAYMLQPFTSTVHIAKNNTCHIPRHLNAKKSFQDDKNFYKPLAPASLTWSYEAISPPSPPPKPVP